MEAREARKQRRREQVREEILDATRRVLLSRGIAGLTLAAVARELQLTKAALYHYFASKEALVFEMIYLGLEGHAAVVSEAIATSTTGADALEALIRASAAHYGTHRDDLRLAYLVPQVGGGSAVQLDAEQLARIRPFNARMYGAVAAKIAADQERGRIAASIDGRRLAFVAHMAVLGMLTMEGIAELAGDPLLHAHGAMVDELVQTFRARLAAPS